MANSNKMRPAAALTAAELVAYQDGAVVSRTLIKRAGGTMTLFAFDEGQALSEHTAPFDVIAHVLDGEASATVLYVSTRGQSRFIAQWIDDVSEWNCSIVCSDLRPGSSSPNASERMAYVLPSETIIRRFARSRAQACDRRSRQVARRTRGNRTPTS